MKRPEEVKDVQDRQATEPVIGVKDGGFVVLGFRTEILSPYKLVDQMKRRLPEARLSALLTPGRPLLSSSLEFNSRKN